MEENEIVEGQTAKQKSGRRSRLAPVLCGVALAALALLATQVVVGRQHAPGPIPFALLATPAYAQQPKTIVLVGGMLINGLSVPPLHNAAVVIQGDKIVQVGPATDVKIPPGATVIDTSGQTMMPGLIEAHAHLFMVGYGDEGEWFKWLASPAGKKYSIQKIMELSAYQMLESGVTSAIDVGGMPADSVNFRDRINKGEVPGPRLQVAGALITRTPYGGFPPEASAVIHSPEEGAEAVDRLYKQGVDIIKAHAGLTREDYFAIVKAAHAHKMKVHAHVYDEAAVRNAFDAGVDVLQHVGSAGNPTYSPELVRAVSEAGRPIVLTAAHRSWIYPDTVDFPERLQDPVLKSMFPKDIWEALQESLKDWTNIGYFTQIDRQMRYRDPLVKQWIASGAVMGVGTDSGTPMNFNTDALIREMKVLADEGVPPLEVISDTTRVNARIMGKNNLGTIQPGKLADLIVVPGNPLYSDLTDLAYVRDVIKGGIIYKRDGKPTIPMPK